MKSVASSLWSRLADVAGLIATPLSPSHYLGLLRPLAGHQLQARVEATRQEAPGVTTLTLRPGRGWQGHRAGQHTRVGVAIDGRITARMYSISSAPGELIAITVKAQGRVSNALCELEPGAYVSLGAPEGDFATASERILFVTGGSGITPVMSMLRSYAQMPDVVHIHYARTADDVIFAAELFDLAAQHPSYRSIIVLTATDRRRFTQERLAELVPDWRDREALACGPAGLLEAVAFTNARVERFAAAVTAPSDAVGGHVRFGTSRVSAISDGRTPLLRIAESAGLAPPSGCRMGICHTCDATLTKGCVRDLRTGDRLEAGARIQICVCAAAGDVELSL